jgi:exosortase
MRRQDLIKFIFLCLPLAIAYTPTFIWIWDRWTTADTYYSHGPLIPIISCFIVWLKRKQLSCLSVTPSNSGWILFITGVLIGAISAVWQVYFSSGFSFVLVLAGLILLFLGKDFLKRLLFPLLFLFFMVPLPLVAISNLSFRLKILASKISVFLVNRIGLQAIQEGSIVKTKHSYLVVEDPCSGIRSLIALIALGCLMAYFSKLSRSKKIILFVSAIPIAILSNVLRITALTLVSEIYGSKAATGTFHDVMGFLVFVFAFTGLTIVAKVLE